MRDNGVNRGGGGSGELILETQNIRKHYGGVTAIDGVSFEVRKGELHSVIGPNGAGKSTFFKLLIGADRPNTGTITFKNEDITKLRPYQRARRGIAVKFQNMRLFQDLTVYQNLFIPLRRHMPPADIPEGVKAALAEVHLEALELELVRDLSHGQQQWLAIALAIAAQPELLLLDEPAAGMGPDETNDMAGIIKRLHAKGMTVLVVEHDMAFVRDLAAHTTVLHQGRIFADGTFAEIERNEEVRRIYLGEVAE